MQKMNEPFVTFPHIHRQKEEKWKKKQKKQEMLQYVTDAPEGPLCDTPSHYALSFCDVSLNLPQ